MLTLHKNRIRPFSNIKKYISKKVKNVIPFLFSIVFFFALIQLTGTIKKKIIDTFATWENVLCHRPIVLLQLYLHSSIQYVIDQHFGNRLQDIKLIWNFRFVKEVSSILSLQVVRTNNTQILKIIISKSKLFKIKNTIFIFFPCSILTRK